MTPNTRTVLGTSFAIALVFGLSLVFVVWGLQLNRGIHAPGNLSIAFGMGNIVGFSLGIGIWINRLVPKVQPEEIGIDYEYEPQALTVIQDADTDYPHGTFDLPEGVTPNDMIELARQILVLKKKFSHTDLAGHGKPFSRPLYEAMRGYCYEHQWITWNSNKATGRNQGLSLRKEGLDAFNQLLNYLPTSNPLPANRLSRRENTHAHTRT